jgi:hypothetical protein
MVLRNFGDSVDCMTQGPNWFLHSLAHKVFLKTKHGVTAVLFLCIAFAPSPNP